MNACMAGIAPAFAVTPSKPQVEVLARHANERSDALPTIDTAMVRRRHAHPCWRRYALRTRRCAGMAADPNALRYIVGE